MNQAKILTFIGLVLLLTGLVVTGLSGQFTLVSTTLCLLGLIAGSFLFVPRVTRNRWLYLNMTLYSLFFCATLLVFYLILQRHPYSYDATRSKAFTISPVTRNFLGRLSEPIRATAFLAHKGDITEAGLMLGQYARYSPQFTYSIVNPFVEADEARRFGLEVMPGDVYLERMTTDSQTTLKVVKLTRLSEEEITNGIVQLLRGKELNLYFLTGHGEMPLEENRAAAAMGGRSTQGAELDWLRAQLERSHMRVLPLNLQQRQRVPTDASVVVIVAPKDDLLPAEKEALQAYTDDGGRVLFLLNPDDARVGGANPRSGFNNIGDFLKQYGIEIPSDLIVMPLQPSKTGGTIYTVPAVPKEHRITNQLDPTQPIIFDQARPVNPARIPPEFTFLDTFLVSEKEAFHIPIEQFSRAALTGQRISLNTRVEDLKSYNLGVAAVRQRPGQAEEQASRVVVFGNGTFVSTRFVDQNGWLMFLNSINWLTDAGDLIAIPTTEIENTPVVLTDGQRRFLFVLLVIAVPTLIGLGGLGYSISRRGQLNS